MLLRPVFDVRSWGNLFSDRGYINQKLFEQLRDQDLQPITKLMPRLDKVLLRKRALIERVNDQLRNISRIEHTQYHSATNGTVNLPQGTFPHAFTAPVWQRDCHGTSPGREYTSARFRASDAQSAA